MNAYEFALYMKLALDEYSNKRGEELAFGIKRHFDEQTIKTMSSIKESQIYITREHEQARFVIQMNDGSEFSVELISQ